MDEIHEERTDPVGGQEQVVFLAPELLQAAQLRQERLGARHAVLYVHGSHIRICALLEIHHDRYVTR